MFSAVGQNGIRGTLSLGLNPDNAADKNRPRVFVPGVRILKYARISDDERSTTHPRQRENCAIISNTLLAATHSRLSVFSGQVQINE